MSIQQIIDTVSGLDGALVLAPEAGSRAPEIAWGDFFFSYAPSGEPEDHDQPYATIVTKDYPDDSASRLGDGRWRVNIHVDRATFQELVGEDPRHLALRRDVSHTDVFLPHPVYGALSWVSVVNPDTTLPQVLDLVRSAHAAARARTERRRRS
ncbi:DUF6194 family protein [Herbiconiux sp. UC225_62]|uniref:DUF6194 family protein n=1 Tax=Herbiconiux sp. UC225_62 TaxID=3350168 RepID=UPI0036D35D81